MKRVVLDIINFFLNLFGARIVDNYQDQFLISYGLQRIIDHGIEVNNIYRYWSIRRQVEYESHAFISSSTISGN